MAAPKFGRNYSFLAQVDDAGTQLTIEPPFTLEFDITRNILTSANVCQIRIYNLSQKNRDLLRYDFSNTSLVRPISLKAGYGNNIPAIFTGNITQAWSVREGVNFITTIECFDGGYSFVNSFSPENLTFPAGTELETVYKTLMGYIFGTTFGAIGPAYILGDDNTPTTLTRSFTPDPNRPIADILNEKTGGAFFIDNGRTYILGNNECLTGQVAVINSQSGLLGTPLRENNIVTFDMLFEPGIVMRQKLQLDSLTSQNLNSFNNAGESVNGFYQVVSIKHRGMISESVCGDAITTLELFFGTQAFTTVSDQ